MNVCKINKSLSPRPFISMEFKMKIGKLYKLTEELGELYKAREDFNQFTDEKYKFEIRDRIKKIEEIEVFVHTPCTVASLNTPLGGVTL